MVYIALLESFIPQISLFIFIFGLGFYWISAFFVLYHLIRFGIGIKPKKISFLFLLGSIALSLIATVLFMNLNIVAVQNLS